MRLSPLVACRLVALDKNPGVRPISVGEVVRRIVMKAILRVVQQLVEEACGVLQTCSGLPCGIEAAVHAMRETYAANSTEGILLVDATNAFNSLNREAALHNIQHLCPAINTLACNTYSAPARLFVFGGGELASQEGTTQGDPLSMALYARFILPMQGELINNTFPDNAALVCRRLWGCRSSLQATCLVGQPCSDGPQVWLSPQLPQDQAACEA